VRCDFCFAPDPTWNYETTLKHEVTFSEAGITAIDGDSMWAACDTCSTLIECKSVELLVKRVAGELDAEFRGGAAHYMPPLQALYCRLVPTFKARVALGEAA